MHVYPMLVSWHILIHDSSCNGWGMHGKKWPTLDEAIHLERPPDCVFEGSGLELLKRLLIEVVDHISRVVDVKFPLPGFHRK